MNKERFIDFLVDYFSEPTDTSESDEPDESGSDESEGTEATGAPNADGIALADEPTSSRRTPRTPRPESARAQKQNEKPGFARRAAAAASSRFKSVVNRARGISGDAKTDLSTLLSDLKHVSENDADAPPV